MTPRWVRFAAATLGLLGLFTGGFLGVFVNEAALKSGSALLTGVLALALGLACAAAVVFALRVALAPEADGVDPQRLLKAWGAALGGVLILDFLLPEAAASAHLTRALEVLAVWGAGLWGASPEKSG